MSDAAVMGAGPVGPGPDAALLRIVEVLREFMDRPGYAFSDKELLVNIRAVHAALATMNAAYLSLVADLDTRPSALPGAAPGRVATTFLQQGLRVSGPQAGRDVRAAKALASGAPELPLMAGALAAGEVSREHVDVAVSTIGRVPKALKTKTVTDEATGEVRSGAQVVDEVLTRQSRASSPATVEVLGRQIVARLDPDRAERFDADPYERRSYSWSRDFAGMGLYKFAVDPATDAMLQAAIGSWSAPTPAGTAVDEHGDAVTVTDTRTASQRKADAVVALLQAGAATRPATGDDHPAGNDQPGPDQPEPDEPEPDEPEPDEPQHDEPQHDEPQHDEHAAGREEHGSGPEGGDVAGRVPGAPYAARPFTGVQVTVVATLEQLMAAFRDVDPAARAAGLARIALSGPPSTFSGSSLSPETLARLACDSPVRRLLVAPTGAVLDHGRAVRYATPAQRRALAVRDNGCIIPGCNLPPEFCDAHHLVPWEDGGATDLDNLALLCSRHHTAHHYGVYLIEMRDGLPWVRIPRWQDITAPWLRNTTHQDLHHAAERIRRTLMPDQQEIPYWPDDGQTEDAA